MRLFVAVQLSEEIKKSITDTMHGLKKQGVGGSYAPKQNLHLTLAFIGEVEDAAPVKKALATVSCKPFKLSLDGMGTFEDLLWVGVKGNQGLSGAAKGVRDALLAAGIMGVCLILTYSRGCYLGLLFAAAVFLVLLDRRFLFLGIIAVALCPLYLPESVISRFTSIGNMADSSTSYRVRIWLGSLAMLKDFGFSGVGFGSEAFNTVYPAYAMHGVHAQHAHNLFLQILCDSGIVGLLVFLGLIVSFYRMMLTAIRHELDGRARIMQIGGVSAVSGFLVQSLTDYTFYNYRVMLLFFGMLGLCVLFARRREAA